VKKIKAFFNKHIANGSKGAISLFLAVLMTPFLSIAMILVEVGRYNSCVSVLDESMGISLNSILANYDEYIHDRFGILSIDQETEIGTEFTDTLLENGNIMGDSLTIHSSKAEGIYPLSTSEILKSQLLEFSKLQAPTKLVFEGLNISDVVGELEKKLKSIGNIFNLIGTGAEAVDNAITIADCSEELKTLATELDDLVDAYDQDYKDFSDAVDALASKLSEGRPADEDSAKAYDDEVKELKTTVQDRRDDYAGTLKSISSKLSDYREKMEDCKQAIADIQADIAEAASTVVTLRNNLSSKRAELSELNKQIEQYEKEGASTSKPALYTQAIERKSELERDISELSVQETVISSGSSGVGGAANSWMESFKSYSDENMGAVIRKVDSLKKTVSSFRADVVTADYTLDEAVYHSITISGYISAEAIDAYLTEQATDLKSGNLKSLLDGILDFIDQVLGLNLLFDPELSANIDTGYYTDAIGGLPGGDSSKSGVLMLFSDIGSLISNITSFSSNLMTLRLKKLYQNLKGIITSIGNIGKDIVSLATDFIHNIVNLFTSIDRLYLTTYATYNLPCRTDYNGSLSFTGMSGYSLKSDSLPSAGIAASIPYVGEIIAIVSQIKTWLNGSGSDKAFYGAELEYVLLGSNSELGNQAYVFLCLYLLRVVLDIGPVLCNAEVQGLAASATIGYPAVMILEILAEGLADTLLLVNGGSVGVWKTQIFMTPSGLPKYISELSSIMKGKLTEDKQKEMTNKLTGVYNMSTDDYNYQKKMGYLENTDTDGYLSDLFKLDYREHCLLMILLSVTNEQILARLANIIQMESCYYYTDKKHKDYTFDLKNAFTYISAEADVSVKQLLPALADSSLFDITRVQYRGY